VVRGKRNLTFAGFEIAVGLLGIVDGWHEIGPVVAAFKEAGIGGEEALFHNENPEHLAFGRVDTLDFPLHFFCC
jgi:hypothetical protein